MFPTTILAQQSESLTGTVTDQVGKAIPSAAVEVKTKPMVQHELP